MQSNPLVHEEIAEFFRLLEEKEPRRCMFDLEGRCEKTPVNGHFIQEGLLKLIRDSNREVKSFYNLNAENLSEMSPFYGLSNSISTKLAARRPFLCKVHEQSFATVENPKPNWDNPLHLSTVSYRACLINSYIKEWFIKVWSELPFMWNQGDAQDQQLKLATPLLESIRNDLIGQKQEEIRHAVAYIECQPTFAATGVIAHPPIGSFFYNEWENRIIPVSSSPIAITVLPQRGGQVALLSYKRDDFLDGQDLLNRLEYSDHSISTGKLSKKIIEEMELIHISPVAWDAFGEIKQTTILNYWIDAMHSSENEVTISPNLVDLLMTK